MSPIDFRERVSLLNLWSQNSLNGCIEMAANSNTMGKSMRHGHVIDRWSNQTDMMAKDKGKVSLLRHMRPISRLSKVDKQRASNVRQ